MRRWIALVAGSLLYASAWAAGTVPASPHPPPAGLADLAEIPGIRLSIGYATSANFTGAPLPGYEAPGAWLLADAAAALARVNERLASDGLGLLVYDAYRPERASAAMVAWAERTGHADLLRDGYIAARSQHNHGRALDLTLCDLKTGAPLDMGGAWDTFSEVSHTANATGEAAANRAKLVAAMRAGGFANYSREWWHFTWTASDGPSLDVPYGPM